MAKGEKIKSKIYTIRDIQVMLDADLAELYNVETKALNQAVKRNAGRFPENFMFQLSEEEFGNLKPQIVTSTKGDLRSQNVTLKKSRGQHRKYLPYAFIETSGPQAAGYQTQFGNEEVIHMNIAITNAGRMALL